MALPFAKKRLGQHWLTDTTSLEAICAAANLQAADTVLEIGPGPGTLTELLVKKAGSVVAVELDTKLASELKSKVNSPNLTVINQDILSVDLTILPPGYKLVANIPYYLTSNLIRLISESPNPPAQAVLLVQKEVARRLAAQPGEMSLLSVTAQFYWQVSLGPVVAAQLFTPPPKVDSQVVILKRRPKPLFPGLDSKQYFRLVKAGFSQRRKTLLNSLSGGLNLPKEEVKQLCQAAGLDPGRRAQTLSLEEWHSLYKANT